MDDSVYAQHLRRIEFALGNDILKHQTTIDSNHRAMLVDYLVYICDKFEFHIDTLFLAIQIVDRYLALTDVPRGVLQLVGITSLLLAAKAEETINNCPTK